MKCVAMIGTLVVVVMAAITMGSSAADAAQCWYDGYGNVQNGWHAYSDYQTNMSYCCPWNTNSYNEYTNICEWISPVSVSDPLPRSDDGSGFLVFLLCMIGVIFFAYDKSSSETSGSSSSSPTYTVASSQPSYEPREPPRKRPRVIDYDPNPKPKPGPRIIEVVPAASAPKPSQSAPPVEAKPRTSVKPSTTAYIRDRAEALMKEFDLPEDEAATLAQHEFGELSAAKDRRAMKKREGMGPKS